MKLVLKLKSIRYESYGARFQGDSDIGDIVMFRLNSLGNTNSKIFLKNHKFYLKFAFEGQK